MQIEVAGEKAWLEWQYFWDDDTEGYEWVTTRAILRSPDRKEPIAFEDALCNPQDRFCKDIGRKISLTRLLQSMNLSKEERRNVWNAYFDRSNQKKEAA